MNIGMRVNYKKYKGWKNFQKVIDKVVISANNSISKNEDWVVEVNNPIKTVKE